MRLSFVTGFLFCFFSLLAKAQPLTIKKQVIDLVDSLYSLGLVQTPISKQLRLGTDTSFNNQWVGSPHYKAALVAANEFWPVSYTHLTLPTTSRV